MVAEVFARHGTLDKFIGDGMLAVYGTFGSIEDAPDRAVETALAMAAALDSMNAHRRAKGLPLLRQRIGLHSGPALVGNVDAGGRMEFTVIGDTVNRATRYCEGAGPGEILMSPQVHQWVWRMVLAEPVNVAIKHEGELPALRLKGLRS
jgi:class 3 adenylate cyclase